MTRRRTVTALVIALAALGVFVFWPPRGTPPPPSQLPLGSVARPTDQAGAANPPGANSARETAEPFSFRGVLLGLDGGGVEGVEVEAFDEQSGGVFAGLACACAEKPDPEDDDDDRRCDPVSKCGCESNAALLAFLAREPVTPIAGRARTGPGGAFSLTLDAGTSRYSLRAEFPGASSLRINLVPPEDNLRLRARPLDDQSVVTVHGRVVDERGEGIAGAPVLVFDDRLTRAWRTVTNPAGWFRVEGSRSPDRILSAVGGLPPDWGFAGDGIDEVTLRLARWKSVTGRVVRGNAPAAGVTVETDFSCAPPTRSDGTGRFSFELPPGTARFSADDGVWHGTAWSTVAEDGESEHPEIVLSKEGRLEGVVVDHVGRPIAGARVSWSDPHPNPHVIIRGAPSTSTDELGRFTIESKGGGNWKLDVWAKGHLSQEREVSWEPGEVRRERFELADGVTLAGVVVDESGTPIRGATVEVRTCEKKSLGCEFLYAAETTAGGAFSRDDFPPGPTKVLVTHDRFLGVVVPVDLPERALRVTLHGLATLTGRVLDARGEPAPNAVVMLQGPRMEVGWGQRLLAVDAQGAFSHTLIREGPWRVFALAYDASHASVGSARLELEVGSGAVTPVTLRLSAGASLRGRVQNEKGSAVDGAQVFAVLDDDDGEGSRRLARMAAEGWSRSTPIGRGTSTADGAFELKGLLPTRLQVWAEAAGGLISEPVFVEPGAAAVALTLRPAKR